LASPPPPISSLPFSRCGPFFFCVGRLQATPPATQNLFPPYQLGPRGPEKFLVVIPPPPPVGGGRFLFGNHHLLPKAFFPFPASSFPRAEPLFKNSTYCVIIFFPSFRLSFVSRSRVSFFPVGLLFPLRAGIFLPPEAPLLNGLSFFSKIPCSSSILPFP